MPQVGILAAFGAGLLSFLSPCVLPLIPAYVSFMTGMSLSDLRSEDRSPWRILGPVMLFVLGFTVVFVALGATASVLGSLLNANRTLLNRIAGVIIVLLGLVLLDIIPTAWLGGGIDASSFRKFGPWAALALGLAFPFICGPCAGPVYGAILTMAANGRSVGAGSLLLLVYSAGIAVPFVAVSLLLGQLAGTLKFLNRHTRLIRRIAGGILVVMGLAVVFGVFDQFTVLLQKLLPT